MLKSSMLSRMKPRERESKNYYKLFRLTVLQFGLEEPSETNRQTIGCYGFRDLIGKPDPTRYRRVERDES